MADVLIRDIDPEKLEALKSKAANNNRSLQAELHEMINAYTGKDLRAFKNMVSDIQAAYISSGKRHSDSTDDLRELRDSR